MTEPESRVEPEPTAGLNKRAIRRSYDELAGTYAEQRSTDGPGTEILREFLDSLREQPRILDAGCGQGEPALSIAETNATAIGLDASREQLRLARDRTSAAALVEGDLTRLPFATDSFDAIVALWSIIHVPIDEHEQAIEEFARVLGPGDRLLLCEGTDRWCGENPDWLETGVPMAWNIAGAETTAEQLRAAGFAIRDRWGVPESLDGDEADSEEHENENEGASTEPWTFFDAKFEE